MHKLNRKKAVANYILPLFLLLACFWNVQAQTPGKPAQLTSYNVEISNVEISANSEKGGMILIDITDFNSEPSSYKVIYELHIEGNFQVVEGLIANEGQLKLLDVPYALYNGFQVVREMDLSTSNRYPISKRIINPYRKERNESDLRLATCSGSVTKCNGVTKTYSNLTSDFYYNIENSSSPCGFRLNNNCSISERSQWRCISGDLEEPFSFTQYKEVAYTSVGVTALAASRINWVICNYGVNDSGVQNAIWYLTGTGGNDNAVYHNAVAAVTSPDGSQHNLTFYKPTINNPYTDDQRMVKWECQSISCDDRVITCESSVDGNYSVDCDRTVCEGSSLRLGVNGYEVGSSVNITGPNNYSSGDWGTIINNFSAINAGTYTATVINGNCTYTKDINISICDPKVNISGTVFNDTNGNGNVDGIGINNPSNISLYATLLNQAGNIVASAAISGDGTYSFSDVTGNMMYTIQLGTTDESGNIGNTPSAPDLPSDWKNTGEDCCDGAGTDGNVDGIVSVNVGTTDVTMADFGIITKMEITICGNVFYDTDLLQDNKVDGLSIIPSGINAVLVQVNGDMSEEVVGVVAVPGFGEDMVGEFCFEGLSDTEYYVILTTNSVANGDMPPSTSTLPTDIFSTGENIGAGIGSDGEVNGTSANFVTMTVDIDDVNFGIIRFVSTTVD